MSDDDDWPPAESPAEWVWVTGQGQPPHFGVIESVLLEPEQIEAETRRQKRRRATREFGFR